MIVVNIKPEREMLRDVLRMRERFNAIKKPNLGDLSESGLFSFAGRLREPFGAWHCPACWMDYARGKYSGGAA